MWKISFHFMVFGGDKRVGWLEEGGEGGGSRRGQQGESEWCLKIVNTCPTKIQLHNNGVEGIWANDTTPTLLEQVQQWGETDV